MLPASESLKDTLNRVAPILDDVICPDVRLGKRVLVVSHMNTIRAMVKHLSKLNE